MNLPDKLRENKVQKRVPNEKQIERKLSSGRKLVTHKMSARNIRRIQPKNSIQNN